MKFCVSIIISVLLLLPIAAYAFSYTKEISQDEVQTKLDSKFPLKKKNFMISTTLSDPLVTFIGENNRVGVEMSVDFKFPAKLNGSGRINLDGSLRYDNKSGSFYFDNIKINKLSIKDLDDEKTNSVKSLLEPIVRKALEKVPVYKFNDNFKEKLIKSSLKSIKVEKELLLVELSAF